MRKVGFFALLTALASLSANADTVVTSKSYVDTMDATKVDIAQSVGTNNANVGKTLVVNSSGNLELGTPSATNYVEDSITDGVTNKAPSENAVHDALEDKQDVIDANMMEYTDGEISPISFPTVVSYDGTNGVSGTQYGIVDDAYLVDNNGDIVWPEDPSIWLTSMDAADLIAYSAVRDGMIGYFPASGATRTSHNGDTSVGGANASSYWLGNSVKGVSLVTRTTTNGLTGERQIFEESDVANYDSGTTEEKQAKAISIPTMGAVMAAISANTPSLPAGSANQVLQYNGTTSAWESTTMDTTPTQSSVKPVTSGGVKTYVDSAVATKQDKIPANNFTAGGRDLPGLVGTTDSAGVVDEIGFATIKATLANNDSSAYAALASGLDMTVENLELMDSMVPSFGYMSYQLEGIQEGVNSRINQKQDKLGGSGNGGKVVMATDTAGVVDYKAIDSEPTNSSPNLVTSGGVYDSLAGKQDKLGGSGNGGKVVTATDTAGTVAYTTINTTVDTSSNLITAGGVKTYVDSKISTASSISSSSTTTAPNEKAVYDSINAVQSAVTTLQGCTHTCANTACTLIDINCVNS